MIQQQALARMPLYFDVMQASRAARHEVRTQSVVQNRKHSLGQLGCVVGIGQERGVASVLGEVA